MSIDLMKRLGIFVVLVLVQGLVFNHIHLFNCATPLLYIIMVLHFRRNHPRWAVLLWCFMMGLCIDAMNDTSFGEVIHKGFQSRSASYFYSGFYCTQNLRVDVVTHQR